MTSHTRPAPAHPGRSQAAYHLSWRRLLILAGLAALTVTLLLYWGDGRATLVFLAGADWRWIGLAVAVHYSGFAVRGHRWQILLRTMDHRLGYFYTTAVLLGGWFASALLPARAGDALRVAILRMPPAGRPTVPVADGVSSLVLERALDLGALFLLGTGFGALVLGEALPRWLLATYGIVAVLLIGAGLTLVLAPALLDRLAGWSQHQRWQQILDFARRLAAGLHRLPRHPATALIAGVESLYIWLCDALLLWLVVRAVGEPIPFDAAAFVALSVDVLAAVPVTPGGMGQVETAYAALLALLPLASFHIAAVILGVRAISYWSFLLVSGAVTTVAGFGRVLAAPTAQTEAGSASATDPQP